MGMLCKGYGWVGGLLAFVFLLYLGFCELGAEIILHSLSLSHLTCA